MPRYSRGDTMDDPFALPLAKAEPQPDYLDYIDKGPVWRHSGRVVLFRMQDILAVNRHPGVLGTGKAGPPMADDDHPLIPLELDGPEQTKFRRLLDPLFAPKSKTSRIASLDPVIRALANELIDDFIDQGHVDAYEKFCVPLPTRIFVSLLGLPLDDLPFFLEFKDSILRPEGETPEERTEFAHRGMARMLDYLNAELDRREGEGTARDDLIGGFMTAEVDGDKLTREQMLNIIYLLVIAGLDTVTSSLSCLLMWLAQHPQERQRLVDDPSLFPAAVEELMRLQSPVQWGHRWTPEDIELPSGALIKAGEYMQPMWAAANLDPEVFPDPLTVNFDRQSNRHIAFASGFHRCLGSHLARLELVVALEEWHKRIPDYRIQSEEELVFFNFTVRAVSNLQLTFGAGA
jgi:cytochrome P450